MAAIEPGIQKRPTRSRDAWPAAFSSAEAFARGPGVHQADSESASRQRWRENRESGWIGSWWYGVRRMFWRRVHRLNAPVVYPWFGSARARGIEHDLHRAAARVVRSRVRGFGSRCWHRCKIVTWPVAAAVALPLAVAVYGGQVRRRFGLGWRTQVQDLLRAAWRHGIFPTEFFHRRVFCEPVRSRMAHFICEREMIELTRAATQDGSAARVNDALRFLSECRACGLAVMRTVASFRRGELEFRTTQGPALLPEKDLIMRPVDGRAKSAGERWHWHPVSRQWNYRGESCGMRALFERCRRLSRSGAVLVQEALNNHPEVARYSGGGLVEIRIATLMENGGDVLPLFAAMRMPSSRIDGFATSVLEAAVDVRSGALSHAVGEFISDGEFDLHPETGAVITGTTVPRWNEMLELVRRAHRQFHDNLFLHWRVGLAGNGPVLLGAGSDWETFPYASPSTTRLADACLRRMGATVDLPGMVDSPASPALVRST